LVSRCKQPAIAGQLQTRGAGLLHHPRDQRGIQPIGRRQRRIFRRHRGSIHTGRRCISHRVFSLIRSYTVRLTVPDLGDLVSALREAAPEHKLDLYRALGLRLTYHPEARTVHANIDLGMHRGD
jgi:hypothetical protein